MKFIILSCLILLMGTAPVLAQSSIGGVNSGAVSGNNLMYAVGEIFVTPTNANDAASGTMALVYRTQLLDITTGLANVTFTDNIKLYPNPASGVITLLLETPKPVQQVMVLNMAGQVVLTHRLLNGQLNVSELANGSYVLHTDNITVTPIHFVKQ